jgi:putative tricarboxylic transport membrane protein
MIIAEWLVCILSLLVSVIFFIITFSFPQINADPGGLALFPRVFCVFTGGGSLLLVISLLKHPTSRAGVTEALGKFRAVWRKDAFDRASSLTRLTTYIFVLSVIYPAVIVLIGFLTATIAYIFFLMKLLRTKTLISLAYSVILGGGLYFIFATILEVYLPVGILFAPFLD